MKSSRLLIAAFVAAFAVTFGGACSKSESTESKSSDLAPTQAPAESKPVAPKAAESTDAAVAPTAVAPRPITAPGAPGGPLRFETLKKDFGKIRDTLPQTLKFPFKNTSEQKTVKLVDFTSSCGCVGASSEKSTIGPGEEGSVTVTFNPQGREGKDEKTITITTDDPEQPYVGLTVNVEVVPVLYLEPRALYIEEKSNLFATTKPTKKVTFTSRIGGLDVTSAAVTDPHLKLKDLGKETMKIGDDDAVRWAWEVVADTEIPEGRINAKLEIKTNDPSRPVLTVTIVVESTGELKISQNPIYLRLRQPGVLINRDVVLMSRSNKAFKILSAEVVNATTIPLTVTISAPPPGAKVIFQKVVLHGTSGKDAGDCRAKLVLTTDLEEAKRLEIPIFGGFPEQPTEKK